jgi:hypothetical protein
VIPPRLKFPLLRRTREIDSTQGKRRYPLSSPGFLTGRLFPRSQILRLLPGNLARQEWLGHHRVFHGLAPRDPGLPTKHPAESPVWDFKPEELKEKLAVSIPRRPLVLRQRGVDSHPWNLFYETLTGK